MIDKIKGYWNRLSKKQKNYFWYIIIGAILLKVFFPEQVLTFSTMSIFPSGMTTLTLSLGGAIAIGGVALLTNPATMPIGIAMIIGAFLLVGIPLFAMTYLIIKHFTLISIIVGGLVFIRLIKLFK